MKKIYYILIVLIIFTPLAFADTVYLKSGKEVKGKIIEESDKYVRMDLGEGVILRYYKEEIERIEKDTTSESKVFTLKPSPLVVPRELPVQTEVESSLKIQSPSSGVNVSEQEISPETAPLPAKVTPLGTKVEDKDNLEIERIVKEYLNLVSKPLPKTKEEKKQRLEQLARILDLANMPAFLVFKEILEQEAQKKYMAVDGRDSAEDKFLESDILGFQKRFLAKKGLNIEDFKIKGIYFSKERDQATAVIDMKDNAINLKLQKRDSGWLINSTY